MITNQIKIQQNDSDQQTDDNVVNFKLFSISQMYSRTFFFFFLYIYIISLLKKKTSCSQGELRYTQTKISIEERKCLAPNKAPTINIKMTCDIMCNVLKSFSWVGFKWVICIVHNTDRCHIPISIWSYILAIKEYLKSINQTRMSLTGIIKIIMNYLNTFIFLTWRDLW